MKILQIVNNGFEAGGAEKSVHLIKRTLTAHGHKVLILSTDKDSDSKNIFADMMIPAIEGSAVRRLIRHFWNQGTYKKVQAILTSFEPDIVHLHTISEFSPSLLWAIRKKPALMTVHGPEEFTTSMIPWLLPAGDYHNNSYRLQDLRTVGKLRYCYYRYAQRPAYKVGLKHLKLLIAPSRFMETALKHELPRMRIKQIYNGIDLLKPCAVPDNQLQTILYVGRLEAVKGVDYLIKAFAHLRLEYPQTRLKIIGNGSQFGALKDLAQSLGLASYVNFAGWIPGNKIAKEYEAASIVAIPSLWPENLPTVGIEALAVGRPLIGTNTGGIKELINDNVNGKLVKTKDIDSLAAAMRSIVRDHSVMERMAKASASKAQQFDINNFVSQLIDLYSSLI